MPKLKTRAQKDAYNALRRERYAKDPQYRQRIKTYQKDYQFDRRRSDPEYAAHVRDYHNAYYATPAEKRKRHTRWMQRYWGDPVEHARLIEMSRAHSRKYYRTVKADPKRYAKLMETRRRWYARNRDALNAVRRLARRKQQKVA